MHTDISHSGIVESVSDGCVRVRILQTSACAACKVAGYCHASESKEKIVEVGCRDAATYQAGQEVMVFASKDVARRALIIGFGWPLLILIVVLLAMLRLTGDEGLAALCALGALVPYYLGVYLFRNRIGQQLTFRIESSKSN